MTTMAGGGKRGSGGGLATMTGGDGDGGAGGSGGSGGCLGGGLGGKIASKSASPLNRLMSDQ